MKRKNLCPPSYNNTHIPNWLIRPRHYIYKGVVIDHILSEIIKSQGRRTFEFFILCQQQYRYMYLVILLSRGIKTSRS
jgi:hypothetical protein